MRFIIVLSGEIINYDFHKKLIQYEDRIICADGGARHIKNMGYMPEIILGDLDSIGDSVFKYFLELKVNFIKYPRMKDETDSEIAIKYAIDNGATEIVLIGALGSRWDHSIANILLLKKIDYFGLKGVIINETNVIQLITSNKKLFLKRREEYKVSLIPLSNKVKGIKTKGLLYNLNNQPLFFSDSIGISNEFIDDEVEIYIEEGELLVFLSKEN